MKTCELCLRKVSSTTKHHLIPRTVHKNKWFKKNYSKEQFHTTVDLCKPCHSQIHRFIPEKEMAKNFNTLDLLRSHPKVSNFLEWMVKRYPEG
ncbi:MAG: hypothetical protein AAF502_13540 [Bacteroidota bacterium]